MKKETLMGILMIFGAITLLFSQFFSYKGQEVTGDLIECMDVQIKFQDIRDVMNEYLLRYSLSNEIIDNHSQNNYSIKTPLFNPLRVYESPVNLSWYFDKETNLQWYFNETGNLNFIRPMWEDCSMNLLLYSRLNERYSFLANFFLFITLIVYSFAIYLHFKYRNQQK